MPALRAQIPQVWRTQPISSYNNDGANVHGAAQRRNLREAVDRWAPFWDAVRFLQLESVEAARFFANESLDFVAESGRGPRAAAS